MGPPSAAAWAAPISLPLPSISTMRTGKGSGAQVIGQGGAVTEYRESEWHDGSLSLVARPTAASGQPVQRLTFTPINDSTVRQHGELSKDGGSTWTTSYDFYYHRRRS